ncbi:hypothetical protein LJB42_004399 [Komagataella kurtzmanii]|nr:hypothetical protein LJB42_004399 [Komagataella kurtzmanii]
MSRLERLVLLLDTGSTPFIRNTAADQLTDLAKQHPEEILNLLSRVYPYLRSKRWETRVSTAKAFGGIVSHAPVWDPNADDNDESPEQIKKELPSDYDNFSSLDESLITFDDWNLYEIITHGRKLLASGDGVLDHEHPKNLANYKNDIKRQKRSINSNLGLPGFPQDDNEYGSHSPELDSDIKKEDLEASVKIEVKNELNTDHEKFLSSASPGISETEAIKTEKKASARMKALARRKAKANAKNSPFSKNKPVDLSQSSVSRQLEKDGSIPELKQTGDTATPVDEKSDLMDVDITSQANGNKIVVEHKMSAISPILQNASAASGYVWPFQGVYELMLLDLFDPIWEIRHGAAMGLRELLKKHALGAGRVKGKTIEENNQRNNATLEDLSFRILSLFALDRFGDYVSDTVVTPVRENAAQTLATVLLHLHEDLVLKVFHTLADLITQDGIEPKCWEAKHGGMLGLRYFVSVKTDILFKYPDELLSKVVDMVLLGLNQSSDDDVQSVAASTLTPITKEFVKLKLGLVFNIVDVLWGCLTDIKDDLSAAIGSVMDLLAKLCSHTEVLEKLKKDAQFKTLIPRLYPFLRHSITSVRKSVLRTLQAFLTIDDPFVKDWIDAKTFRLIFQNILLEQNSEVLALSYQLYETLLQEATNSKYVTILDVFKDNYLPLLALLSIPIGVSRSTYAMPRSLLVRPRGNMQYDLEFVRSIFDDPVGAGIDSINNDTNGKKRKMSSSSKPDFRDDDTGMPSHYESRVDIDAPIINGDLSLVPTETFVDTKTYASKAYGRTLTNISDENVLSDVFTLLLKCMQSPYSSTRLFGAIVLEEYSISLNASSISQEEKEKFLNIARNIVSDHLSQLLQNPDSLPFFRELTGTLKGVRTSCLYLFATFTDVGKLPVSKVPQLPIVVQGEVQAGPSAFSIETSRKIIDSFYDKLLKSLSPMYRMSASNALEDAKKRIELAIHDTNRAKNERTTRVLSAFAALSLQLNGLPKKLNPAIRSLMDSVKSEELETLQLRSATSITHLVSILNQQNKKNAADKITKNLSAFLCVDTSEVPEFTPNATFKDTILSLKREESKLDALEVAALEREAHFAAIKRRGALYTLNIFLDKYGVSLFEQLPTLKSIIFSPLEKLNDKAEYDDETGQSLVDSLGILRALFVNLHPDLRYLVIEKVPLMLLALKSQYSVFRYCAARLLALLSSCVPTKLIPIVIKDILPMINDPGSLVKRQGSIEFIFHLSVTMGPSILPYVVFLIVPVLGRMSDANNDVRFLATTTFASIIKLVPLEAGIEDPPDMPKELLEGRDREREFIQQMMDPTKIKPFELPVSINATLRKYQQEGVNWLAFLNKYHLHGILCDDMGLGKTLQTICIVASDHYLRQEEFAKSQNANFRKIPSLIVCPPSLTGHWEQEFKQYAAFMTILVYTGSPSNRSSLRGKLGDVDVIITSYDVARNDLEHLVKHDFNYCVLDEGHIIKNSNTKLTKSVKKFRAEHRLILSGTPIQNNVLELWSLFDFLMPGFLGTEKIFQEKFAKPIAVSRNSKTSSKEQEAGALALESLHKQVLPFMLRRLKEDVLSDLPPKIIQDYYCQLSDLQRQLYRDFAKKQKGTVEAEVKDANEKKESKQHIFQALQYMRKLCNHPALVVTPKHPQYADVQAYLRDSKMDIRDIRHAPKLVSLKTLLLECGIGSNDENSEEGFGSSLKRQQQQLVTGSEGVISQHRALIFCQLKDMLDMVENDLLRKHMPSVTYMRLDGSTDPHSRQSIVRKFNEDPSIDLLLLTTKVGGLGLNLTGADTVIFVEHDWNPMNDLQAMDRAHRLGQKKVVNVYRLITQNTLEERIMGLQKFKMNIASSVVNQQNAGLASMDTGQLLDLFNVEDENGGSTVASAATVTAVSDETNKKKVEIPDEAGLGGKAGSAVGELAELWDASQYEEEYDLDSFIKTLK